MRSVFFVTLAWFVMAAPASSNTLLILGDSLSAAYGVPTEQAWVALLEDRLSEQGFPHWSVVNASISGETTDGGLRRLPALLERHSPSVVVIELGGNDGLRGLPPAVIEQNLSQLIELTEQAKARPLLVGMQIPPNYGPRYTNLFAEIFPKLASNYDTALVPFFLEGIYNRDGWMQADGIHPTAQAQPALLNNIWPALQPLLETH
nr:arylesterase [Marinobacter sp. X15-166B]